MKLKTLAPWKKTYDEPKVKLLSHVRLFATPQTVAYQASLSMGFSRQEYWRGLPFPSPGDLPSPGIEPRSPTLQADTTLWATREAQRIKKQRHCFTDKGRSSQSYGFSSSHVCMCELDHKEGWVSKYVRNVQNFLGEHILMFLNCGVEDSWESLGLQGDQTVRGNADWNRPPWPGSLVTICMNCFTTGGPGKEHGTN